MAAPVAAPSAAAMALKAAPYIATIAQGAMQGMSAAASNRVAKKQIKETKRRTYAELLNAALQRQAELNMASNQAQQESYLSRAKLLQDTAQGLRQSLI